MWTVLISPSCFFGLLFDTFGCACAAPGLEDCELPVLGSIEERNEKFGSDSDDEKTSTDEANNKGRNCRRT